MSPALPAQGLPVPSLLAGLSSEPPMEARKQESQEAFHENHSEERCREEGEAAEGEQRAAPQLLSFMSFKAAVMSRFLIKMFFKRLLGFAAPCPWWR